MNPVTYMYVLAALAFGFQITTGIVLFRKYRRTRAVGFLWLAIAAVVWPILVQSPHLIMNGVTRHRLRSLSFVSSGQITLGTLTLLLFYLKYLIGASILLAAVAYLCKTKDKQLTSS